MSSIYELHVTVEEHPSLTQTIDFEKLCRETLNCKANLIELSGGKYPMQLMLAAKFGWNTDEGAMEWGRDMERILRLRGWNPVRTKVESALKPGPSVYFESHYKLLLPTDNDVQGLNQFVLLHPNTFLSSRNQLHDGVYYLSMRSYQPDHKVALKAFEAGRHLIEKALSLESYHYERVVYDSFPGLDEGWVA